MIDFPERPEGLEMNACRRRPAPHLPALALLLLGLSACSRPEELRSLDPPAVAGAMAPRFWAGKDGLHLSWLEPAEQVADPRSAKVWRLRLATLSGERWSEPRTVISGADFFRNWADTPAVAEWPGGGLAAHWLERLGDSTYAYGVKLARSAPGAAEFAPVGLLHEDASPTEHGFVSWVPEGDGLRAFWLDGRAMAGGGEAQHHGDEAAGPGDMQLRSAVFSADGKVSPSELIDDRVCECCQTDAAATDKGPIVVYRDRDGEEIRDIELRRREGGGWSAPTRVAVDGWKIPGCPVNGPAVAVRGEEVLVFYFTGAEDRPRTRLAVSQDGGRSFAPPVTIDDDGPLGRVDLALGGDGTAWMSWLDKSDQGGRLQLRCRQPDGKLSAPRSLALNTGQRSAGVPRILVDGESLLVTWVDDLKPTVVKVVRLSARCEA
jgi:hypothetical protein